MFNFIVNISLFNVNDILSVISHLIIFQLSVQKVYF